MTGRFVPGDGPTNAKIVFVGEAPGETEEEQGKPFVGASGSLFNRALGEVGVNRNEVYITNVVKIRPPKNDFTVFYEDGPRRSKPTEFLKQSIQALYDEIRSIKPNIVCGLGAEALKALTGRWSISNWRGSIIQSPVGKCVCTYHPAYILRQFTDGAVFKLDLRRVVQESRFAAVNLDPLSCEIWPSFERVMQFLASRPPRIAVDIETSGPRALVRCLGIADSPYHALCIPFIAQNKQAPIVEGRLFAEPEHSSEINSRWSETEERAIWRAVNQLMMDRRVEKVLQNAPFDMSILANHHGIWIRNLWMDTLLAQHTTYCELEKDLGFLTSIHTRIPCYWEYQAESDESTFVYNCKDAIATYQAAESIHKELVQLNVHEFYHNHVQPSMLALTLAQNHGFPIDQKLREGLAQQTEKEFEAEKVKLAVFAGGPLNPDSPKQVMALLYDKLRMRPVLKRDPKTKQYKPTSEESALDKLWDRYPNYRPVVDCLLECRAKSKLLGSFLRTELQNGRIYTSFNVAGTVNGRISSSKTILGHGGNLQQIPRGELRRIFAAPDGWLVIKADLSQADFRVVMWLARVERIIQRYIDDPNFDVHRWNAAENVYHIPESQVTKEQRTGVKPATHGSNYGMTPIKTAKIYNISEERAAFLQNAYHRALPEIKLVYWPETEAKINATRTLVSPLGRRRQFFDRLDERGELYRSAYSTVPQMVVGDVINRGFSLASELFDLNECRPLLQVHDEIVCLCRKEFIPKYVPWLRRLMEYPIYFPNVAQPLIIPAEISVGPNWYDQKEVK